MNPALVIFVLMSLAFANTHGKSRDIPNICATCDSDNRICCRPGDLGPGKCYNPPEQSCCQGVICQSGQRCCYKGSNGIGGCFQADSQRCCPDGLICDAGETCCNGFCGKDDCTKS